MIDWDKLRIFHSVAAAQSLTRGGELLGLSQSAVSRQISALEDSLQVALFNRHARGLVLTEQGEILYKTVNDIFTKLAAAENALLESKERPRGPLKITAPTAIGTMWLVPHLREFHELYPEIQVTLLATDRELDLIRREADVAIRLFPAKHPDLVQKKLIALNNSLYASNDYLREHGVPRKASDLLQHRFIVYAEEEKVPFDDINWVLMLDKKLKADAKLILRINSMRGIFRAVESGLGIAGLPDYMVHGMPHITKILPEQKGPQTDVFYTYSTELRNSKRVRVFRDFIVRKFDEDGLVTRG